MSSRPATPATPTREAYPCSTPRRSTAVDGADGAKPIEGTCWTRPFGPAVNVRELNSTAEELNVRLAPDERTAYLASNRPGVGGVDLHTSTRATTSAPFETPVLHALSTTADDTHPSLSFDGLSLYFASTRTGTTDLYVATRGTSTLPFTTATIVSVSTPDFEESFPWIAASGELMFASNRAGDMQLYRAPRAGAGFGAPVALSEVNEPGTLSNNPVLSNDGTWLYFASSRTTGGARGELDIWVAHRASSSVPFDPPTNVAELNTASSDRPAWLSGDGCRMYLTSTREGGVGSLDVWRAER